MNILQIAAAGLIAVILILTIKKHSHDFAFLLSIATGVLIFIAVIPQLNQIIGVFNALTGQLNINDSHIKIVIKIIGIAYIAEFAGQLCADAGENAIAAKIELAGKVCILTVSLPVILGLVSLVTGLL